MMNITCLVKLTSVLEMPDDSDPFTYMYLNAHDMEEDKEELQSSEPVIDED